MGHLRQKHIHAFAYCFRAAGQVDDQRLPPDDRHRAGEHRAGGDGQRSSPDGLGNAGGQAGGHGHGGLGGHIPGAKAGAAGGQDQIELALVGQARQGGLQGRGVVRQQDLLHHLIALGFQPLDDGGELGQAHEDDQGALRSGQPVQLVRGSIFCVGGDHVEAAAQSPVGDGNARLAGDGDGGGDAGHYLKGDAHPLEGLDFLAPPAKDEGVSALEADHCVPRLGQGDERLGDVLLGAAPGPHQIDAAEWLGHGSSSSQN